MSGWVGDAVEEVDVALGDGLVAEEAVDFPMLALACNGFGAVEAERPGESGCEVGSFGVSGEITGAEMVYNVGLSAV